MRIKKQEELEEAELYLLEEELLYLANEKIENMKTFMKEIKKGFYNLKELKEIQEKWE